MAASNLSSIISRSIRLMRCRLARHTATLVQIGLDSHLSGADEAPKHFYFFLLLLLLSCYAS